MDYLIYNKETDELIDIIQLKDEKEKQTYEDNNLEYYLELAQKLNDDTANLEFNSHEENFYK